MRVREHPADDHPVAQQPLGARRIRSQAIRLRPSDKKSIGERFMKSGPFSIGSFGAFVFTVILLLLGLLIILAVPLLLIIDLGVGGGYVFYWLSNAVGESNALIVMIAAFATILTTVLAILASHLLLQIRAQWAKERESRQKTKADRQEMSWSERLSDSLLYTAHLLRATGYSAGLTAIVLFLFSADLALDLSGVNAWLYADEELGLSLLPPEGHRDMMSLVINAVAGFAFTAFEPVFVMLRANYRNLISWFSWQIDNLWYDNAPEEQEDYARQAIELGGTEETDAPRTTFSMNGNGAEHHEGEAAHRVSSPY